MKKLIKVLSHAVSLLSLVFVVFAAGLAARFVKGPDKNPKNEGVFSLFSAGTALADVPAGSSSVGGGDSGAGAGSDAGDDGGSSDSSGGGGSDAC